ncbi:MAG: PRC-barrel domain-containing protein [Methanobrevibacter sp.]|nr:PRC-barrel domain-containing protein [Methanobrevibacter sp.]
MKIKEFLGCTVLDKNAYEVGKVDNIDFDPETGKIDKVTLTLQKNIFSRDELEIEFDDIATIGAYVILNKEIPKETEETVEATIEVEEDEEDE